MTLTPDDWPLVVTGGPWPQRIGLRAREVRWTGPGPRHYPWASTPKGEIVVLIENDPLRHGSKLSWSCVLGRADVSPAQQTLEVGA